MTTKIEWTQETWNPIVGCSKVSPGCQNCYAERMAKRVKATGAWHYQAVVDENGWTGKTVLNDVKLMEPRGWKKPRMIFVCSMSDLFHETVEDSFITAVMSVIQDCPQHTFQILTKRAERMTEYFSTRSVPENVWVGVTAEDQERADERIPHLLQVDAPVRFVSVEPMLGSVNMHKAVFGSKIGYWPWPSNFSWTKGGGIQWVICGGESGPGARPMHPDWVRYLRDQCHLAKVPFFLKQMKVDGKMVKMPTLDGEVWDQIPG